MPTRHAVGKEQAAPRRRPRCAAANADASRARGRRDASKVAARALSRPAAASRYFPWRAAACEHGTVAAVSQRQPASRACRHHELTSLSGCAPPLSLSSCAASRPWSPPGPLHVKYARTVVSTGASTARGGLENTYISRERLKEVEHRARSSPRACCGNQSPRV